MKIIIAIIGYLMMTGILGMIPLPPVLQNPHRTLLGVQNVKPVGFVARRKPDLASIKTDQFYAVRVSSVRGFYEGLLSIKPQKDGTLKIGGGFFKDDEVQKFSLMSVEMKDQKLYYDLEISMKPGSGLFKTTKSYTEKFDFPVRLQIQTSPGNGKPTIIMAGESLAQGYKLKVEKLDGQPEEELYGKWQGSGETGDWALQIGALQKYQFNGTAKLTQEGGGCHYPLFGFVAFEKKMIVMTGESTENPEKCPVRAWVASSNYGMGYELNEMGVRGGQKAQNFTISKAN